MRVHFDYGPMGPHSGFDAPVQLIRADDVHDVPNVLDALDAALLAGKWVAGFASYELGYALEPKLHDLMPADRRCPLILFGVYDAPQAQMFASEAAITRSDFSLSPPTPLWEPGRYAKAFQQVHDYIGAGDIYQANLTFPTTSRLRGNVEALAQALTARQHARYGVMLSGAGLDGAVILSRSPELFFSTDAQRKITTRPMKGTAPRGHDAEQDRALAEALAGDAKNRAENLMITDLLRNDLSRIAAPGSVNVPRLFEVETLATLHQMTSEITAELRPEIGLSDIFKALFPCGSITGAPKLRAMEILAALEPETRDIYCGSIGWAAPDGRAEFNVAIRTLLIQGEEVRLNVGGGVVWDSDARSEYEEALWKLAFARQLTPASA